MCCPLRAVMGRRPITVREPRGKMTCSPHFVWFADDVALSRDIEAIPAPIAGLDPSRNREPAANAITGKPHWAEAELGEQLYAGGKSRREDQMTGRRMLLAALACAAIATTTYNAFADDATDATSPQEIGRQLKSRGLPLGTLPMGTASPLPSSAASPDVHAAPLVPGAPKSRGVPSTAAPPQTTAAAHPSVTLKAITVEPGSAKLKPDSLDVLRNLGIALNQIVKDGPKLLIEGHTDNKGTAAYNMELSMRRADAVKEYLVREMGVPADRLETVDKGFSEPANLGNPNAPENRRVVVVNLGAS